jgi:hypothetical protein
VGGQSFVQCIEFAPALLLVAEEVELAWARFVLLPGSDLTHPRRAAIVAICVRFDARSLRMMFEICDSTVRREM